MYIDGFLFSYIVWLKKGYQEFQEPRGTSVIKVKGVARVTENNFTRYVRMLRKNFCVTEILREFRSGCWKSMGCCRLRNSSACMFTNVFISHSRSILGK